MPPALQWTPQADALLRHMRAAGQSWHLIGCTLRVSRWAAIERGRRIGAPTPIRPRNNPSPEDIALANPTREPLRAGHPRSWGAINAGTCLAGSKYPTPPPERPIRRPKRAAWELATPRPESTQ